MANLPNPYACVSCGAACLPAITTGLCLWCELKQVRSPRLPRVLPAQKPTSAPVDSAATVVRVPPPEPTVTPNYEAMRREVEDAKTVFARQGSFDLWVDREGAKRFYFAVQKDGRPGGKCGPVLRAKRQPDGSWTETTLTLGMLREPAASVASVAAGE